MAEPSNGDAQTDQLATIPYEVVRDQNELTTHDSMFKLIIIGDSCKYTTHLQASTFSVSLF